MDVSLINKVHASSPQCICLILLKCDFLVILALVLCFFYALACVWTRGSVACCAHDGHTRLMLFTSCPPLHLSRRDVMLYMLCTLCRLASFLLSLVYLTSKWELRAHSRHCWKFLSTDDLLRTAAYSKIPIEEKAPQRLEHSLHPFASKTWEP